MDLKAIAGIAIILLVVNFLLSYGIALLISAMFGVTEPWAKAIIMALVLMNGPIKTEFKE